MRFFKEIQTELGMLDVAGLGPGWRRFTDRRVLRPLLSCLALMFFFQGRTLKHQLEAKAWRRIFFFFNVFFSDYPTDV